MTSQQPQNRQSEAAPAERPTKASLRSHVLAHRAELHRDGDQGPDLDARLAANLASLVRSSGARTVAAYHPLGPEPGGAALLPALAGTGARILLPISLRGGVLHWAYYQGKARLERGLLGIPVPSGRRFDGRVLPYCDLIICPAVAASDDGRRLGRGGGYYDRAIAAMHRDCLGNLPRPTLALAVYHSEVFPSVAAEPHDMQANVLVTDRGITDLHGT